MLVLPIVCPPSDLARLKSRIELFMLQSRELQFVMHNYIEKNPPTILKISIDKL